MSTYTHKLTRILTPSEFNSNYNNQSFIVQGEMIKEFETQFPSATITSIVGTENEGGGVYYFFIDIESDVTPLDVAQKLTDIYANE
jgi:hypothetical protein